MPKGVEHYLDDEITRDEFNVTGPLMPKGVEHTSRSFVCRVVRE